MLTIPSSPCVPDPSGLDHELFIARMARALEKVVKLADPNQRRVELRRAGFIDPRPRDEHAAVARVQAKRRALAGAAEVAA